jgi:hypothetical protein
MFKIVDHSWDQDGDLNTVLIAKSDNYFPTIEVRAVLEMILADNEEQHIYVPK